MFSSLTPVVEVFSTCVMHAAVRGTGTHAYDTAKRICCLGVYVCVHLAAPRGAGEGLWVCMGGWRAMAVARENVFAEPLLCFVLVAGPP